MTAVPDPRCLPGGGGSHYVRDKGALSPTDYNFISFAVWEDNEECPHCGSDDIEYAENGYDAWAYCCDCGKRSAYVIDDTALNEAVSGFLDAWMEYDDRFEVLDNFEKEKPGWDF